MVSARPLADSGLLILLDGESFHLLAGGGWCAEVDGGCQDLLNRAGQ